MNAKAVAPLGPRGAVRRALPLAIVAVAALMCVHAPAAYAQQDDTPAPSRQVTARLAALPPTVAGVERSDENYDLPLASYGGRGAGPLIALVVTDARPPVDIDGARAVARAEAHQAGLIETLFEGTFRVPGREQALTFFGDYLTDKGIKQSWFVQEPDGMRTLVTATIYDVDDRRRVFDGIRNDLFGGAEMVEQITAVRGN